MRMPLRMIAVGALVVCGGCFLKSEERLSGENGEHAVFDERFEGRFTLVPRPGDLRESDDEVHVFERVGGESKRYRYRLLGLDGREINEGSKCNEGYLVRIGEEFFFELLYASSSSDPEARDVAIILHVRLKDRGVVLSEPDLTFYRAHAAELPRAKDRFSLVLSGTREEVGERLLWSLAQEGAWERGNVLRRETPRADGSIMPAKSQPVAVPPGPR